MRVRDAIGFARREIREGRFQRAMALMAAFAAVVSGFESYAQHRRAAFADPLMWTPVALMPPVAAVALAVAATGRGDRLALPVVSVASIADGVVGFGLHVRGIQRMPGGFHLGQYNVVMGPPIFAPLLMSSVGVLGLLSAALRPAELLGDPIHGPRPAPPGHGLARLGQAIAHGRFERGMAVTAASLAVLAGGEAYFEHLRGSFNDRLMWTPVWLTPPMVAAGLAAAANEEAARLVLPIASVITFGDGLAGFVLHLRGIRRMPGGFSQLDFGMTMGPPLFAPLLFSSVGVLGLLGSLMRRGGRAHNAADGDGR